MTDTDITIRLRRDCMSLIADEAADEIEHLRAQVKELTSFNNALQVEVNALRSVVDYKSKG